MKYSKNKKLNGVLTEIEKSLLELGIEELKHYKNEFKYASDYNIAQYGNLLVYYDDVQELYKNNGYVTKFSDNKIWEIYKRQVGYVTRILLHNFGK